MLGRHALHDEDHDVAPCQVHRRAVRGLVYGREMLRQLFGGEIFFVIDASRAADRPQDAERVAQDEVRLAAVVGIEGGVRKGDRSCHAGHAAAHACDREPCTCGEDHRTSDVVGPAAAQQAFLAHLAAVTPCQQRHEGCGDEYQVPVFSHELTDELHRIAVVGKEDFIGGEPFLRVPEIDAVGHVDSHDQHGVHCDVVPVHQFAVPAAFAHMQGQQRQQDEYPVGIDDRCRVELERPGEQLPQLTPADRPQQLRVVEIENHAAEHQYRVEQCDAPQQQGQRGMEQAFHGLTVVRTIL